MNEEHRHVWERAEPTAEERDWIERQLAPGKGAPYEGVAQVCACGARCRMVRPVR